MPRCSSASHESILDADDCAKFGGEITADGLAADGRNIGFGSESSADVCYDFAAEWMEIFLSTDRAARVIRQALLDFVCPDVVQGPFHSYGANALKAAVGFLGCCVSHGPPFCG